VTSPTPAIAAVASHAQAAAHAHCTVVDVTLRYVTRQCDTHRTGHVTCCCWPSEVRGAVLSWIWDPQHLEDAWNLLNYNHWRIYILSEIQGWKMDC